ncbi:MAG: hypothetical protein H7144_15080 [Burkholderiales bacterium]|nr:hypothetical protein [Phycisphaerae bacterium]
MGKSNPRVEISSDQLKNELTEIKDRVGALETIATISNRAVVEEFVKGHLTNEKGQQIMKLCQEPRTREYLMAQLKFANPQALDYHLKPLRENDLLRQNFDDDGVQTFEWSNLFKRLPKPTIRKVLDGPK